MNPVVFDKTPPRWLDQRGPNLQANNNLSSLQSRFKFPPNQNIIGGGGGASVPNKGLPELLINVAATRGANSASADECAVQRCAERGATIVANSYAGACGRGLFGHVGILCGAEKRAGGGSRSSTQEDANPSQRCNTDHHRAQPSGRI